MDGTAQALQVSLEKHVCPEMAKALIQLRLAADQKRRALAFPFEQCADMYRTMRDGAAAVGGHLATAGFLFGLSGTLFALQFCSFVGRGPFHDPPQPPARRRGRPLFIKRTDRACVRSVRSSGGGGNRIRVRISR